MLVDIVPWRALLVASVPLVGCSSSHGLPSGGPADSGGARDATAVDGGTVDTPHDGGTVDIHHDGGSFPWDIGWSRDAAGDAESPVVIVDGGGPVGHDGGGGMPTEPGGVGAACTSDADCDMVTGASCFTTVGFGGFSVDAPGGYCSATCVPPTGGGTSTCGPGAQCLGAFGAGFCAKSCSSDADCRAAEGYSCQAPPFTAGPKFCVPSFGGTGVRDSGLGWFADSARPFP